MLAAKVRRMVRAGLSDGVPTMIYVLAALLPPLGLLFNGQPFSAIFNVLLLVVCIIFGLIFPVLFFVPWLDTSKVRSAAYRPRYRRVFWLFVADAVFLGWLGAQPAEGAYVLLSQLATLGYFAFFLVALPLLGLIETPRPLPHSITEAVLDGQRRGNGESVLTLESVGAKKHR